MGTEDLRQRAQRLAADPSNWTQLVRHDPLERVFEPIVDEPDVEGWLICWMPGHDTGFHDHDISSGAVTVLSGQVLEERLTVGRVGMLSSIYSAGETFEFAPSDIHRVTHAGGEPTVTLHVYSPRIERPGAYTVSADGVLSRHSVPKNQELRPLRAA
ncbi:MAG TPA: cysteine dioxygenase family protein [Thermoleophilaceae bacterium]|jgi:predicted metal-dependent enzyme (double-stranded beta helix superfamily)